jgi:glyoxylase-like metal-dependent hydrolase (beta-lactamase superfamily II)
MKHDREFDPRYGAAVELVPGVRRLTAENPGPFTFHGTNTYLLGTGRLICVDPGPELDAHTEAILRAAGGAPIDAILVTHTHMDHSPGARLLQARTGAPIVGCGPHKSARALFKDEVNPLDASGDRDHAPDRLLEDDEIFAAAGLELQTIATPGHTANHLCFSICGENLMLSADHVMAWSTSVVAPPDGSMKDYMASLDRLLDRPEDLFLPGHGGVVREAHSYVRELKQHRQARESAILGELQKGTRAIPEIVAVLYAAVDPALHPAAGMSVFAHLEELAERGLVLSEPSLSLTARFSLNGPV